MRKWRLRKKEVIAYVLIAAIVTHVCMMIYSLQNAFWFWTSQ